MNFIIKKDKKSIFKFAAIQSEIGEELIKNFALEGMGIDSIIYLEKGKCYTQSTAALRIAKLLGRGWKFLYGCIIIPAPIRNLVYQWIAKNRYQWFGKRETCMIPTEEIRNRFL